MRRLGIGFGAVAVFGLVGGLLVASLALSYPLARLVWRWREPAHYRYDVYWRSSGYEEHWQVEIRNGQVVGVVSAAADRPADMTWLPSAKPFVVIDGLFQRIRERTDMSTAMGLAFVRLFPDINHRLAYSKLPVIADWAWANRCADPPPLVRYDLLWGHPASVQLRRTRTAVCGFYFNFGDTMEVQIEDFEPLP